MEQDTATPSQAVIKDANRLYTVRDAQGRTIEFKQASLLDRMRLFELIGGENSANDMYCGYAMLAYQVRSIDGDQVAPPTTKAQLEALLQRLENDGMKAVSDGMLEHVIGNKSAPEAKDAIKNESSTPA